MKRILIFLVLSSSFFKYFPLQAQPEDQISLSGAFALYPMAVKWAEEFKKVHPKVKIDISAGGAGKGITDVLSNMVDIGMVSRDLNPEEIKKGAFDIAVTKDAVVITANASNPVLKDLLSKGIKKSDANEIWITGNIKTWGQILGNNSTLAIHTYTRSDASGAAEIWAKFFGKKQDDLLGIGVFGDPGVANAVKNDPLGIGFNNVGYAYDSKTKKTNTGIIVVPLDLNHNGKIDPDEDFYKSLDQIIDAIASGRYPSPPARDLLFVTNGKPQKKIVVEFINWVLTDGQKYMRESGFINLSSDKIKNEIQKLK